MSPVQPVDLSEYLEAVRNQLVRGNVWLDRSDVEASDGLIRTLQSSKGVERAHWVAACAQLLTDPDPTVRTGLVVALPWFADTLGADWLADLLKNQAGLFEKVAPVNAQGFVHPDLAKGVISAMAGVTKPTDQAAIALLRQTAADPDWGFWVLWALARVDSAWLLAHAREVVPHSAVGVLVPLNPEQRTQLIQDLAPWPQDALASIPAIYWRQFHAAEAGRLQKLIQSASQR